eukprot:225181-Amphidinium_carterae.2
MEESGRSIETIETKNIQDASTADDDTRLRQRFPNILTEDEQEHNDAYNNMTLTIRRKRVEITNFSQTLNYVLVHSTKPDSETPSMIGRIMRQSNGFEAWRQITLHYAGGHPAQQFSHCVQLRHRPRDSTKQFTLNFTKQHYR